MKRVAVIEPPFIEPGMPYPEIFRVADVLNEVGADAVPLDINVRLFRNILNDTFSSDTLWDRLLLSFAEAYFIDYAVLQNHIANGKGAIDDISEDLVKALSGKDILKVNAIKQETMNRFKGDSKYIDHFQYIRDIELFNALLSYKIKEIDDAASLSMDKYSNNVDIQSSTAILQYLNKVDNGLVLLFRRYLAKEISTWDYDGIIIVITNQTQLLPGLALASWIKKTLKIKVTLTGDFIDDVLDRNFPEALFEHLNEVIAYRIDYSVDCWLQNLPHENIISHPIPTYPNIRKSNSREYLCSRSTFPASHLELYFTPLPIVGALISSRCYWSKCKFCAVACKDDHPFDYQKPEKVVENIKKLQKENGVGYIQFMDYAMPPSILNNFCISDGLGVFWSCQARFEKSFLKEKYFNRLFDAGCTSISWGFETGSDKILKNVNKGGVTDKLNRQKILKASAEAGILNHLFVITGLPGETDDDFIETVSFLYENINLISGIEVYPFQLQPHTVIGRIPYVYGFKTSKKYGDWCMDLPFTGEPEKKTAITRAKYLEETFGFVSKRSETDDCLEGHITFSRQFKGTAKS